MSYFLTLSDPWNLRATIRLCDLEAVCGLCPEFDWAFDLHYGLHFDRRHFDLRHKPIASMQIPPETKNNINV